MTQREELENSIARIMITERQLARGGPPNYVGVARKVLAELGQRGINLDGPAVTRQERWEAIVEAASLHMRDWISSDSSGFCGQVHREGYLFGVLADIVLDALGDPKSDGQQ